MLLFQKTRWYLSKREGVSRMRRELAEFQGAAHAEHLPAKGKRRLVSFHQDAQCRRGAKGTSNDTESSVVHSIKRPLAVFA